jgi:hypothetical protein
MAQITPSGVQMGSYNPSNSPQACPAVQTGTWEAKNSPLPPAANPALCSCMYNSISCVVKSGVSTQNYGQLFGQVCGYGTSCAGINASALTGVYGAYSMCNSTEQLSFAFNQYYISQSNAASACNFAGSAVLKSAASAAGSCSALLSQAGSAGTGTVTSLPSGTSTSTKKSAAGSVTVPSFDYVVLGLGVYVTIAAFFGASMILV